MRQTIQKWIDRLALEGKSERTLDGYKWELVHLANAYPGKGPSDYDLDDLMQYLMARRATTGAATQKRTTAAFRNFFAWQRGRERSPAQGLPWPRVDLRRHRSLKADQLEQLLSLFDSSSAIGSRDLALLALLADAGLRASEICRLEIGNLNLEQGTLVVICKGGQEKAGAYSSETASYLSRWLSVRRARPGVETVFVAIGGTQPGKSITRHGLKMICRAWADRAGLPALSPHDLRRTFAMLMLQAGCPTRVLQVAGRWASIDQVEAYSQELAALEAVKYSPVAGLWKQEAGDRPKQPPAMSRP